MNRNYLTTLLVILICSSSLAQTGNIGIGTHSPNPKSILDITASDKGILIPRISLADRDKIAVNGTSMPDINGMLIYNTDKSEFNFWNVDKWVSIPSGSSSSITFNGSRPITADYFTGVNPGTDDLAKWVESVFYPSQGPSADLSVTYNGTTSKNITLEHTGSTASIPITLNWSAARKTASADLSTITVAGITENFTNPAQGASVSGTQSVTLTPNSNITYQNIVTTSDNKSAVATASVTYAWKNYWGFLDGPANGVPFTPSNAAILTLAQELSNSKNMTKTIIPTGTQRIVIAFPESYDGGSSKIVINQLDQSTAFDRVVVPVTNALGATLNYVIYTSKNNTNGSLTFSIQ